MNRQAIQPKSALGLFLFFAMTCAAQGFGPSLRSDFANQPLYNLLADSSPADRSGANSPAPRPALDLPPSPPPRMAQELALETYLRRAARQLTELGAYSDDTVVEADLPSTSQHGRFELKRSYQAPRSLAYQALRFAGDGFVKSNIIVRLLQSEVSHVEKGEGASTAITEANYKFSYKGTDYLDDRPMYVYQVKPRQKRPGLFKGKVYVDAYTGALRRAEGTLAKSPSFFVKKIEFVQDYADVGGFSLPTRLHSVANTRLVGRAIVDILHANYEARSLAELQGVPGSTSPGFVSVPSAATGGTN